MFTAHDRLDPDPSAGQVLVRELAAKASCPDELCKQLHDERTLDRDPVLGRSAHLSRAEEAYVRWQTARGRVVQHGGPLSHRWAVKWVQPGGWTPARTLGTVLLGGCTGGKTLYQLFHEGYSYTARDGRGPSAAIYPDEALAVCTGGSHRVLAHVVGGVLLSPQLEGDWTIIRTTPDLELIELLQAQDQIEDPRNQLPSPLPSQNAEAMREDYLKLRTRISRATCAHGVCLKPRPSYSISEKVAPETLAKHGHRFAALYWLDRGLTQADFPKALGSRIAMRLRGQRP